MAKLIIKEEVYDKVMHWVESCPNEVSGFGRVQVLENGDFYITDAYLIEQEVGAAHTDIDAKALAKLMYESREAPGQLRWWWHSHVNMPVFWSGTDTATIKELGGQGWIAATVFNKKHEYRSAVCFKTELTTPWGARAGLQLDDELTLEIESTRYSAETIAKWDEELATKVKQKTYAIRSNFPHYGTYADGYEPYQPTLLGSGSTGAAVRRPELLAADEEDAMTYGAYGYGAVVEAEALGIKLKQYKKMLLSNDPRDLPKWRELDEQLHTKWRDGTLDKVDAKHKNRAKE